MVSTRKLFFSSDHKAFVMVNILHMAAPALGMAKEHSKIIEFFLTKFLLAAQTRKLEAIFQQF
jgi:hypothetical protein